MKINGNFVTLSDSVSGLTQVAGSEVEFAVEGERVHVIAAPLLNSPQATAADLQGRLEQAGYSQFAVRFSAAGVVIVDGRAFEEKLDQWVINEGGRAAEAAERIRNCFYRGETSLELGFLGLKTLPPVLDKLENLQELSLSYNQLTAFAVPSELVNLQRLDLYNNQLTAFSVPSELVNLQTLSLSHNQLTAFSVPRELVNLQQLSLSYNQLTAFAVPSELVNLQ
ncbi:MAG: leucine-rich repeat domain-containing protein, partial [Verrucomicrobiota bacterium]|nr:leucine-rich repeat domain-containing protein [Verrucomicrobiota bacterium]